MVGRDPPDPREVADPGVGKDQARVGELAGELHGVQSQRRDSPSGVDQHRQRALVRERDQRLDARIVERELLRAWMQLDSLRARVEAARGFLERSVMRVDTAERNQQALVLARGGDDRVVGLGIAVGLMKREHERAPSARPLQRRDQLLRALLHAVGIVVADVRVGVEQLQSRHLLEDDFGPRLQEFDDVHPLIRTMKADEPNPYRRLDARRSPDPQPCGASPARRNRQLVREVAGQALRRRTRGLRDGLELRGALPQRADLPRALEDSSR